MLQRIITGLILIAIGLPCLILGGLYLQVLVFFIALVGVFEYTKVKDNENDPFLMFMLELFVILSLFVNNSYYIIGSIILLLVLYILAVFNEKYNLQDIGSNYAFIMLFSFALRGISNIYDYGFLLMIYLLIAALVCDAAAYFVGRSIGKHKLNSRISPNKTIEGAIGGWLIGGILSFVFALLFIVPLNWFSIPFYILGSIFLPLFSQVGDLTFSLIKRTYGLKDFGSIFPGHGGVLDRFDSMIFSLAVINILIMVVQV